MIKIIKEGHMQYEHTCFKCGCQFEYEAEDVTSRTVWDDHGGHYPVCAFCEIPCPYCGITLQVDGDVLKEKDKMKHIDD